MKFLKHNIIIEKGIDKEKGELYANCGSVFLRGIAFKIAGII